MENPREKLSKRESISIFILIILTLGIVIVGAWQIKGTIYAPFEKHPTGESRAIFDDSKNLDELRNKDTDNDGLNDFEELYVHFTSPYLPDTDSDGMSDSAEVIAGKDPNCPAGQDCYAQTAGQGTEETEIGEETDITDEEKSSLIMGLSPDELRQMLVDAGVPQETLDQLTDQELQQLVSEILSEDMGAASATSTQE